MIDINKFKDFVYLIANKSGRGTLTPSQFNSATEQAVIAWTNNQITNQKDFQPGMYLASLSMDVDQSTLDRLRHLKETRDIRVTNGEMPIPNGSNTDVSNNAMPEYWTLSRLTHKYQNNGSTVTRDIKIVKDNSWADTLDSEIVSPTKKRAVANIQSDNFLIEPSSLINLVTLSYIRIPNTPKWAFTITNNRPVYDSVNSVNIDAPTQAFNEVAMIALEFIGIRIRDIDLVQAATGLENKGV